MSSKCVFPAIVVAIATLVAAPRSTAAQVVGENGADVPRTPWGHPDLQGIWNNSTTTPLERLTEEEKAHGREAQQPVIEATRGTCGLA